MLSYLLYFKTSACALDGNFALTVTEDVKSAASLVWLEGDEASARRRVGYLGAAVCKTQGRLRARRADIRLGRGGECQVDRAARAPDFYVRCGGESQINRAARALNVNVVNVCTGKINGAARADDGGIIRRQAADFHGAGGGIALEGAYDDVLHAYCTRGVA